MFFTDSSENSCDDDSAENGNFKIYSEGLLLETEDVDRKYEGEGLLLALLRCDMQWESLLPMNPATWNCAFSSYELNE